MRVLLAVLLLSFALTLAAQEPRLQDPALEARARDLQREIRCVVCQNESIDSSQAGIARDLRELVRERLAAGDSDEEVREFLVERYGDYVLFRPPMRSDTWVLWFGPAIVLLIGAAGIALAVARRRKQGATAPDVLKPEEEARLARLLAEEAGGKERRS
ncbi:MAG TPA: cytochrome c-type biogenesis protein [Kiloniellales bacterium]|nr:cytochrome c-type biogenesis protein [Kiloniellales bacterium]